METEQTFRQRQQAFYDNPNINPVTGGRLIYGKGPYNKFVAKYGQPQITAKVSSPKVSRASIIKPTLISPTITRPTIIKPTIFEASSPRLVSGRPMSPMVR